MENDPALEFSTLLFFIFLTGSLPTRYTVQDRISHDVCRQAARARRPRGRAAERMLFVRFKVGGS